MQLIIFELEQKQYAVDATFVVEMTRLVAITALPGFSTPYVGVINYHGDVIPVLRPVSVIESKESKESNFYPLESQLIVMRDATSNDFCLLVDRILAFAETPEVWNFNETSNEPGALAGLLGHLAKLDNQILPVFAVDSLASLARKALECSR